MKNKIPIHALPEEVQKEIVDGMDDKQKRAHRMLYLLADHFYLAQVIHAGTSDKLLNLALQRMMTNLQGFYNSAEHCSEDIQKFAAEVGVALMEVTTDGNGQPVAPKGGIN